jgi:delta-aminolevulinic acid dehydratase/porphobilinogen synthase
MRALCADVRLHSDGFIQPLFVEQGISTPAPAAGLPGVRIDTVQSVIDTIAADIAAGVTKFLLFPIPVKSKGDGFDFRFAAAVIKDIRSAYSQ